MPIGFDAGEFRDERGARAGLTPDALAGVVRGGLTPEALGEIVRAEPLVGRIWTRWRTAADERVCPECGPLDGQAWPAGDGPQPPLHNHCRCTREVAFVEWGSRE